MDSFILEAIKYVLSPAVMGAVLVWGASKVLKLGETKKDFEIIKESVKDLKDRTTGLEAMKKDLHEIKTKSAGIVSNITVIKTHLVEKSGLSVDLFQSMSPISLTEKGKKLIHEIGFDTYIKKNLDDVEQLVSAQKPRTLLQLDEASDTVVQTLFDSGEITDYENDAFHRGISTEVLLRACALYLRDFMAKKLKITE